MRRFTVLGLLLFSAALPLLGQDVTESPAVIAQYSDPETIEQITNRLAGRGGASWGTVIADGEPPLTCGNVATFSLLIHECFDAQLTEAEAELIAKRFAETYAQTGPFVHRPAITSINPTSGAPGATVTINGSGFDTLFSGPAAFGSTTDTAARANLTYISSTQMTAVVPAGARQGPIYILSSIVLVGQPLPVQLTSTQIFTPLVAPAAPSGLAATVASSSRINLAWSDNSWNETGFEVWIEDAKGWRLLGTVAANLTSDAITGLSPVTTYAFRVRAQNATGSSAYSKTVTATTRAAIGTVVLTNNSQVTATQVTFNGVAQSPTQASGNQVTFNVAPGMYNVLATLSLATRDRVCTLGGMTTVIENQTSTVNVAPLTAGQVLTHCSGSIDYDQGSYVDHSGFHAISARIHANGTFNWWLDGVAQAALTITSTNFSEPSLRFTLSSGDNISMAWPFASLQVVINGHVVVMTRASGW